MSIMKKCKVCNSPVELSIELKKPNLSSIGTIINSNSSLYSCSHCSHMQKTISIDLAEYYDTEYKLWCQTESSDSLYGLTEKGKPIYRLDKVVELLSNLIDIQPTSRVLDYGCAKGLLSKKIFEQTQSMPYLFDLTDSYSHFWSLWASKDHCFVKDIPDTCLNSFDYIVCNFVFEHVEDPIEELIYLKKYLREGGQIILIVPNPASNPGDYLVVDHIQNYSKNSLYLALSKAGFSISILDDNLYRGAFVLVATRLVQSECKSGFVELLEFEDSSGQSLDAVLQQDIYLQKYPFQNKCHNIYIYGAGFYGGLYFTKLSDSLRVLGFVDQNPELLGTKIFNLPIVSISSLPDHGDYRILIAVNPSVVPSVYRQLAESRPDLRSRIDSISAVD